ncbi:MAG: translation initiation factor IF-2 [Deltaproteobacteria bacterium]|nr:translation initiation factor IF-2 [Deltaproteobacteria bacterium]
MKVRVYELAKDVNMDSKVLAAKLIEFGYDVKSYSSSLDEGTANEIRTRLLATHTEVHEKRIQVAGRQTVIRRRTRAVRNVPVDDISLPVAPKEDKVLPVPQPEKTPALVGQAPVAAEPAEPLISEAVTKAPGTTPVTAPEPEEAVVAKPQPTADSLAAPSPGVEASPVVEEVVEAKPEAEELPAKVDVDRSRQGLARVIKRAAIKLPVEEKRPRPVRRPVNRAKGQTVGRKPYGAGAAASPAKFPAANNSGGDAKGRKGKRFVKFHHEAGGKLKKGGRKKGYGAVNMEDVAMAGGRFSSNLKFDRHRRGSKKHKAGDEAVGETRAIKKRIQIDETISIGDLAHRMGVKGNQLIGKLMGMGVMATLNQALDLDTATLVAVEFGFDVAQTMTEELNILSFEDHEAGGEMLPRPPVVTVMGHVDHGKTSILDAIRKTDVAAGEAGGITQHIGAHHVRSAQGEVIFLDTPGHAAFTEMRSRGAQVTDIVVLVVAADDGVMDQTKEAINHAKAAEVPIVVAVNKIDKDGADPTRVRRELAEYELVPEDWGGSTIFCDLSAKQGTGIEELLEQILLQAEMLELKADPKRKARGWVIEAKLHKGLGAVATILVQQGTLRVGDAFVVGEFAGKVRSMSNDKGETVDESGPAVPVEVHGLSGVPRAGDEFIVVKDEKTAKNVSSQRQTKGRELQLAQTSKISLDNLFEKLQEGEMKELCVLIRADVQGTLEAFSKTLGDLSTDVIRVNIIHSGTGTITDSDVLLASASKAIILGFNVRPSAKVQEFAKNENIDIRFYDVIYQAVDDIRKAMTGMLDPTYVERVIGNLEVRETFSVPKIGVIAGCYVTDGKITRSANMRLLRDSVVLHTGVISSLKRFKDDVKEVAGGYECGVGIENYNDIKAGDTMEAFVLDEVAGIL